MEPRVGNKYRLGRKIGSGSFGEIYLGILFSCENFSIKLLHLLKFRASYRVFWLVGTNLQTTEEVAIKLVSGKSRIIICSIIDGCISL